MLDAKPILTVYAKRRLAGLARNNPATTQKTTLLKLVKYAEKTKFGIEHGFSQIASVADFQSRVPLRRYEDYWTTYWQPGFPHVENITWPDRIKYFAVSSGTTSGNTKFIPVTQQMLASNRKAVLDLLTFHWQNKPDTRIMGGKSFMLGGNADLNKRANHIYSGDLSGISANEIPWWAKQRYFPPHELARISDWDEKVRQLAPLSMQSDIRLLGGTSSWLIAFIEQVISLKPGAGGIKDIYPNLEMLVHGGVNFSPYKRRFEELLEGSRAETREVYPASEGFIAIADRAPGDGLRLMMDTGIFFEFVPVEELESPNPTRHWIETAELDRNYAIVLTTCAGLWAYVLGDTVRFVDRETPRVLVTGRTSYFLSAFGEHLIGEEIETSVEEAAHAIDAHVVDYSVGAIFPERTGDKGHHLYIIEFADSIRSAQLEKFTKALDKSLIDKNLDYKEHRYNDFQMLAPVVQVVNSGTFAEWMKSRGKLGAQNKVPRVINDQELFQSLKTFARH